MTLLMDFGDIIVYLKDVQLLYNDVQVCTFGRDEMIQIRRKHPKGKKSLINDEVEMEVIAIFSMYVVDGISRRAVG